MEGMQTSLHQLDSSFVSDRFPRSHEPGYALAIFVQDTSNAPLLGSPPLALQWIESEGD